MNNYKFLCDQLHKPGALKQKKTTKQSNERTTEIEKQKPKAHGFLIRVFSSSSVLRLPSSKTQSHTDFYNNNNNDTCGLRVTFSIAKARARERPKMKIKRKRKHALWIFATIRNNGYYNRVSRGSKCFS